MDNRRLVVVRWLNTTGHKAPSTRPAGFAVSAAAEKRLRHVASKVSRSLEEKTLYPEPKCQIAYQACFSLRSVYSLIEILDNVPTYTMKGIAVMVLAENSYALSTDPNRHLTKGMKVPVYTLWHRNRLRAHGLEEGEVRHDDLLPPSASGPCGLTMIDRILTPAMPRERSRTRDRS